MPRITSLRIRPNAQGSAEIAITIDRKVAGQMVMATSEDALVVIRLLCGGANLGSFTIQQDEALRHVARFGGNITIEESYLLAIEPVR